MDWDPPGFWGPGEWEDPVGSVVLEEVVGGVDGLGPCRAWGSQGVGGPAGFGILGESDGLGPCRIWGDPAGSGVLEGVRGGSDGLGPCRIGGTQGVGGPSRVWGPGEF